MPKISAKFQRGHPNGGAKERWGRLKRQFSTNIPGTADHLRHCQLSSPVSVINFWRSAAMLITSTIEISIQHLGRVEEMVFAVRRSYASAVLGVVILSVCPSVCLSVCHARALWLIQRTYRRYFYTTWSGIVKCDFSYSCAADDKISTDLRARAVSLRQLSYLFNNVMTNTEWFVLKWFWPVKLTEAMANIADKQTTAMTQPMLANPHQGLWCHFVVITMATSFIWLFYFGVVMSYDGQITTNMASHELGFRHWKKYRWSWVDGLSLVICCLW